MHVLNLMWGFNIGGVGKCFLTYGQLGNANNNLQITTVCINLKNINFDLSPLKDINCTIIDIENRRDLSWFKKCYSIIKNLGPDLIFTHGFNGPVVVQLLRFRYRLNIPFVCSYHGEYYAPSFSRIFLQPIFNWAMHYIFKNYALGITCVSDFSRNKLISYGIPGEIIKTIHNGIANQLIENDSYSIRKSLFIEEKTIIIGSISRLDSVKGIDVLIKAMSELTKIQSSIKLVIVGDGPCECSLKRMVASLSVEKSVYFVGYQEDISSWLALFDVYVLASRFENHSISLLEAMRASKAIVATDVGGNTESVRDGKEALIVNSGDSGSLKNAIENLIKSSEMRLKLSQAARKRFEEKFTDEINKKNLANWLMSFEKKSESCDLYS